MLILYTIIGKIVFLYVVLSFRSNADTQNPVQFDVYSFIVKQK